MVGRTPWSARVPLDPLFPNEISSIWPPASRPGGPPHNLVQIALSCLWLQLEDHAGVPG